MTIEETRQERHKLVAEALKQKSKAKKIRRLEPQPDPVVEAKKPAEKTAAKIKKKEPAEKE